MTAEDPRGPEEQAGREPGQGPEDKPFQFTDKRKVDPETAQPRESAAGGDAAEGAEGSSTSELHLSSVSGDIRVHRAVAGA